MDACRRILEMSPEGRAADRHALRHGTDWPKKAKRQQRREIDVTGETAAGKEKRFGRCAVSVGSATARPICPTQGPWDRGMSSGVWTFDQSRNT